MQNAAEDPELYPVALLSVVPAQPFDDLGTIEVRLRLMGEWGPEPRPERLDRALEARARELEADAVVGITRERTVDAIYSRILTARGRAIRYRTSARPARAMATHTTPGHAGPATGLPAHTPSPAWPVPPILSVPPAYVPAPRPAPSTPHPATLPRSGPVHPRPVPPVPRPIHHPGALNAPSPPRKPSVPSVRPTSSEGGQWASGPVSPNATEVVREITRLFGEARRTSGSFPATPRHVPKPDARKSAQLPTGCAILIGIFVLFWFVNILAGMIGAFFKAFR